MNQLPVPFKRFDFEAEYAAIYDREPNSQIGHLKPGKTRQDAVNLFSKRDIDKAAHTTVYSDRKTVADTIEIYLMTGYTNLSFFNQGVKPVCIMSDDYGKEIKLFTKTELDYIKLLLGDSLK